MISNYDKRTNITVSKNKMLRKIFGLMKNKFDGKYSELGNKELSNLYKIICALKSRSLL
jgi:hypothetical protein